MSQHSTTRALVVALLACVTLPLCGQGEPTTPGQPVFAPPKRIMAGAKMLGAARMYPSPAVHDLNGDGVLDIVIGDLPGRVTVSYGEANGDAGIKFKTEVPLKGRTEAQLTFHNW